MAVNCNLTGVCNAVSLTVVKKLDHGLQMHSFSIAFGKYWKSVLLSQVDGGWLVSVNQLGS